MGGRQENSQEKFTRTLSASLHCLAQPLSIIQASLELALLNPTTVEQYREVAEGALREVARATEAMRFTAQLARFHQPATDVSDLLLSTEVAGALANLGRTLDSAGIRVLFAAPEHEQSVHFSVTRLRQLLFYIVQAVRDLSKAGDVVRIEIQGASDDQVLKISRMTEGQRDNCVKMTAQDSQANRALALADAIVSSGGGNFEFTTHPLAMNAVFPPMREERLNATAKVTITAPELVASSH